MLSEYRKYLLRIRNNLIQCGVGFPVESISDYRSLYELGCKLEDVLWYYSVLAVSGSSTALKGFFLPLNGYYKEKVRLDTYEEFRSFLSNVYDKISVSSRLRAMDSMDRLREDLDNSSRLYKLRLFEKDVGSSEQSGVKSENPDVSDKEDAFKWHFSREPVVGYAQGNEFGEISEKKGAVEKVLVERGDSSENSDLGSPDFEGWDFSFGSTDSKLATADAVLGDVEPIMSDREGILETDREDVFSGLEVVPHGVYIEEPYVGGSEGPAELDALETLDEGSVDASGELGFLETLDKGGVGGSEKSDVSDTLEDSSIFSGLEVVPHGVYIEESYPEEVLSGAGTGGSGDVFSGLDTVSHGVYIEEPYPVVGGIGVGDDGSSGEDDFAWDGSEDGGLEEDGLEEGDLEGGDDDDLEAFYSMFMDSDDSEYANDSVEMGNTIQGEIQPESGDAEIPVNTASPEIVDRSDNTRASGDTNRDLSDVLQDFTNGLLTSVKRATIKGIKKLEK